jgi:hypothetical protein
MQFYRDMFRYQKQETLLLTEMGALFTLGARLLQLFSENKAEFTKLTENLGLYYQIWNDYRGLFLQEVRAELLVFYNMR